ncbi:MAG: hypothetical protein ACI9XC_002752, partial [Gammaproteobacteria bacterium]
MNDYAIQYGELIYMKTAMKLSLVVILNMVWSISSVVTADAEIDSNLADYSKASGVSGNV